MNFWNFAAMIVYVLSAIGSYRSWLKHRDSRLLWISLLSTALLVFAFWDNFVVPALLLSDTANTLNFYIISALRIASFGALVLIIVRTLHSPASSHQ